MQPLHGGVLMPDTIALQEIVSELLKVPLETIDASTPFSGMLANSLGRARLDAALRSRMGIVNQGVYTVKTFGDLCLLAGAEVGAEVSGKADGASAVPSHPPRSAPTGSSGAGFAVGVDIQSVAAMPEATDYWEAEFYRQHFTRQEIAYALLQPSPRESFAAMWCAKEALRKADDRWLETDWQLTEVVHTSTGKPTLISGEQTIPFTVSLSHTEGLAVAVVAMAAAPAAFAPQPRLQPAAAQPTPVPTPDKLPIVLAGVAVLISLLAAGLAFFR